MVWQNHVGYSKFHLWEMIEPNLLCRVRVVYTINRWVAIAIFALQYLKLVWSVFLSIIFPFMVQVLVGCWWFPLLLKCRIVVIWYEAFMTNTSLYIALIIDQENKVKLTWRKMSLATPNLSACLRKILLKKVLYDSFLENYAGKIISFHWLF